MPLDSKNNAAASARTPLNARKSRASESQFLAQQAEDAKTAISRTADDLKHDLAHGVDPRAWVQVAPWTTLATAAVAGFIAATAGVPSKQQQTLRRLARIERAMNQKASDDTHSTNGHSSRAAGTRDSILMTLAMQALRIVQPMVVSAITGALSGKASTPSPESESPPQAADAAIDPNQSETGTPPPT